jgi:hypothetical protein
MTISPVPPETMLDGYPLRRGKSLQNVVGLKMMVANIVHDFTKKTSRSTPRGFEDGAVFSLESKKAVGRPCPLRYS